MALQRLAQRSAGRPEGTSSRRQTGPAPQPSGQVAKDRFVDFGDPADQLSGELGGIYAQAVSGLAQRVGDQLAGLVDDLISKVAQERVDARLVELGLEVIWIDQKLREDRCLPSADQVVG